jgi:hypothetical protein
VSRLGARFRRHTGIVFPGDSRKLMDKRRSGVVEAISFAARLKEARRRAQERTDPWHLRLEGLKGKIWDDGIERVSTQTMFDVLEVPHRSRTAGACRRLAKLMLELGWHPIKAGG